VLLECVHLAPKCVVLLQEMLHTWAIAMRGRASRLAEGCEASVIETLDIKKQGMSTRNATWLRTTGVSAGSCPVLCIHTTNAAIQMLMSFFFSNTSIKLPFLTKNPKKPHEDKDDPCKKNLPGCWNTGQTERAPIQSGFFRYFNFVHNLLQGEEISYCKGWWFW
jgi:hypothetical protein